MKCDELEEEYLWTNNVKTPSTIMVRAYNADDVDKAIAELKARIQLDDDEMAGFLQLEEECGGGDLRKYIAELKAENERIKKQSSCTFSDDSLKVRQLKRKIADNSEKILELQKALDVALSEVYSLLDKIESLKASHYSEMVDAGMENNIIKRALWLTRALRARDIQRWWLQVTCSPRTEIACRKWNNVERKCRAKAEEYR